MNLGKATLASLLVLLARTSEARVAAKHVVPTLHGRYLSTFPGNGGPPSSQRELVTSGECRQAASTIEDLFNSILRNSVSCSGSASNQECEVKCNSKELCCGNKLCGHFEQRIKYDSYGYPVTEENWYTYVDGMGDLNGKTRYTIMYYCRFGTDLCSCEVSLGGQECNACNICDKTLPGTSIPYATFDCQNIKGGDAISYECHELDSFEELEKMSEQTFQCKDELRFKDGAESFQSHSVMMLSAFLCFISFVL